MTVPHAEGFRRVPRARPDRDRVMAITQRKFLDSLDDIQAYLDELLRVERAEFRPRTSAYALATTVIVRVAALFEEPSFDAYLQEVPAHIRRAIGTTRNIAAHAGYREMDDQQLWLTLTRDLPPLLHQWRTAAQA